MKIIKDKIEVAELRELAKNMREGLVKVIVDIDKGIMAVDAPMHADLFECLMREENSEPQYLWGINIHPGKQGDNFIEFDSMMNYRPGLDNRSKGVESEERREKIIAIIKKLVPQ